MAANRDIVILCVDRSHNNDDFRCNVWSSSIYPFDLTQTLFPFFYKMNNIRGWMEGLNSCDAIIVNM